MAKQRRLKNPPIIEAVVDFRVVPREDLKIEELKDIHQKLKKSYPGFREKREAEFVFNQSQGTQSLASKDLGIQGYVLHSSDEKNVLQFKRDGFTYSRLHPYTSWEEIFEEASKHWLLYYQRAKPDLILRIATRYINKITVESEKLNFDKYLTAAPRVPPGLPEALSGFVSKVVLPDKESGALCNFIQALEKEPREDLVSFILDVDVFLNLESKNTDEKKVLERFNSLRDLKNKIFFSSVTEKTVRG